MDADLPEEFDLIVIGTGFPESCVAAAASRIGKTVLHLDPNEFYGGSWSSFNLDKFCEYITGTQRANNEVMNAHLRWHIIDDDTVDATVQDSVTDTFSAPDTSTAPEAEEAWNRNSLLSESRRFNIDLCPKLLYAAGRLVELLISSNICRYAEFRAVDRVCTMFNGEVLSVPCSRSDVFNTTHLNIIEKRLLMKFLTICLSYGEDKANEDLALNHGKTFQEYLQTQKVTPKIANCVMQAIAMCTTESSLDMGMERTKCFLRSLGRYGNTPFLFPMYGCGELPQCFCRLCAVFGGIYCLKRTVQAITIDADTNVASVHLDGNTILKCKHVVCSPGNVPQNIIEQNINITGFGELKNCLSRGVFIATRPLGSAELNAGGGGVNVVRLIDGSREAMLIQLSHYSGTCPKGTYIFHLTTAALSDDPENDLRPFVVQVFNAKACAPKTILSAFFTITGRARNETGNRRSIVDTLTPVFCTAAPFYEVDYDLSIQNARDLFAKIYGDAEFLPRAPSAEEIVMDDEDPSALSEHNLPDDLRAQLDDMERAAERLEIADASNQMEMDQT